MLIKMTPSMANIATTMIKKVSFNYTTGGCFLLLVYSDNPGMVLLERSPQTPQSESSFSDSAFYQQNRVSIMSVSSSYNVY